MYKINDITINSKTYDWRMISLQFDVPGFSQPIIPTGVTSIKYSQTRDSQWNFGIGGRAISKGFGNTVAEGSITMAAFELQNIKDRMTKEAGDIGIYLQNLPMFNILVIYNFDDGTTKTDVIRNCSFNTDASEVSQNDMFIQVDINLDPSDILFGQTVSA